MQKPGSAILEPLKPVAVAKHHEGESLVPRLVADADEAGMGDPVGGVDELVNHPFKAGPAEAARVNVPVTLADRDRRC